MSKRCQCGALLVGWRLTSVTPSLQHVVRVVRKTPDCYAADQTDAFQTWDGGETKHDALAGGPGAELLSYGACRAHAEATG